jgi:hypothetical protein
VGYRDFTMIIYYVSVQNDGWYSLPIFFFLLYLFLVVRFHPLANQTFVVGLERGCNAERKKKELSLFIIRIFKVFKFFFYYYQTSFLVRFQTRPTPSKEKKIWL